MLATAVTQWGQNQNEIASFFAKKNPKNQITILFLFTLLILGQKSCILGPTIFKIPQPN